jgi:hypothetical protein
MNILKEHVEADVRIGDGIVSIRRKGRSEMIQAKVLATVPAMDGQPTRLWLDRLVHAAHETRIGTHPVSGCYVTEMALND